MGGSSFTTWHHIVLTGLPFICAFLGYLYTAVPFRVILTMGLG